MICVLDITAMTWETMKKEKYPLEHFVFSRKGYIYHYNEHDIYIYPQRSMIPIFENTNLTIKSNCIYIDDYEIPLILVQDIEIVNYKKTRIFRKPIISQYIMNFVSDIIQLKGLSECNFNFKKGSWFDDYLQVYFEKQKEELRKGVN